MKREHVDTHKEYRSFSLAILALFVVLILWALIVSVDGLREAESDAQQLQQTAHATRIL